MLRALVVLSLAAFVAATVASAGDDHIAVLAKPASVLLNPAAPAASPADFAAAVGTLLGVPPAAASLNYGGLTQSTAFQPPRCLVSLTAPGAALAAGVSPLAQLPLTQPAAVDSAAAIAPAAAALLGDKVQIFDAPSPVAAGDAVTAEVALRAELDAFKAKVAALAGSTAGGSAIVSHVLSTAATTPALQALLGGVLSEVTLLARKACDDSALVLFAGGRHSDAGAAVTAATERRRRSTNSFPGAYIKGVKVVDNCANYTCYCNRNKKGEFYDVNTLCSPGCTGPITPNTCDCAYFPCDCASPYVMPSQRTCAKCSVGFTLAGGYCYVDSIFPATINMAFWIVLSVVVAIAAVWYSLHSITGGKNSVVDRAGGLKDHSD